MWFEWDEGKNQQNKSKHGLSFETAALVFQDSFLLSALDHRDAYFEERWQSIGLVLDVLIYVAHTLEEDNHGQEVIRIISARRATSSEAKRYHAYRKSSGRA